MADLFKIEGTNFIYSTNFSGDPRRDPKFGSNARKGNIIIPSMDMVQELRDYGLNVRETQPREDDDPATYVPTYYIPLVVRYRKKNGEPIPQRFQPKVYLVDENGNRNLLDEDSIGVLDDIDVSDVKVQFEPYFNESNGKWSQTIRVMYVKQNIDDDPWAADYVTRRDEEEDDYDYDEE